MVGDYEYRIKKLKAMIDRSYTLEGRLEELKRIDAKNNLMMYVPGKEEIPGFYYRYSGYWWSLGGSPKRRDYIQLLQYRGKDSGEVHVEFCSPRRVPKELYGKDSLVKIKEIGIVEDRIRLVVDGVKSPSWDFAFCPSEKIKNLELTVVNEPYRKSA